MMYNFLVNPTIYIGQKLREWALVCLETNPFQFLFRLICQWLALFSFQPGYLSCLLLKRVNLGLLSAILIGSQPIINHLVGADSFLDFSVTIILGCWGLSYRTAIN